MAILDTNNMMFEAFEPKVQNRFTVSITDTGIQGYMVKKATAPSFSDASITLPYINTYRKVRGKREWADVEFTLYDPITPSGAQAVMDWARLSYESVTGRAGYSDFYKKSITLRVLGPVGDIVSEWVYKGAFVTKFAQGSFDWGNNGDPVEINITVSYDYAVLNY